MTTTRGVQATPMMKEIGTGRGSETECMASELGVQLTMSTAELEEQKKLVLDRD